jgi:hypothetical protein
MLRQGLQLGLLGRECVSNDPLSGSVDADVGNGIEPVDELNIEVIEVAEAAAEEEVLADIAERPFYLALRLAR